ncbi:multidrug effflux MFS transporter [Actinomadura parmotrematis]|uniref:Multidrug effflux MFS transporter n=1 Tax=Actinomadura parmotrematis TaxID=2864039 RepID=A0ABS7FYC4_9ACTN|nr:multidrug effflux MFS transporter [Actinomadura parmotrematis]MBW8485444.1 multidrug effflux MFS transporter [Actinomadura parmotrematis]
MAESPAAAVPPRSAERGGRIAVVLILGTLSALAPLSIDMYLPALPRLTGDLSTGPATAQLTLTACVVGLSLGQAVAGPTSDAWGRRRPLLIGLAAYALASLVCAVAPTVQTLIALRLVQGAAGAAGIVIARAVVRDLYDGPEAARFFSVLMLVNGLAPIAAPLLGGQLLRVVPWPGIFAVLTAIGVALLLAVLAGLPETLPPDRRASGGLAATLRAFRTLLADRAFVGYCATIGLSFAALFTYISGAPFVLEKGHGLSEQAFSLAFGVNSLGILATGALNGRLVGRVPLGRLLAAGLAVVAAGAALLLAAALAGAGLPLMLPALFLVAAGQGLVMPNATALALSGRPQRIAGSASALLGVAQFAIGGLAAPLAHTDTSMAATIAALAAAAVLTSLLTTRPAPA